MSDTLATSTTVPTDSPSPSSRAVEQARIRKERREAKIRAGSTARLNKITGLNNEQQISDPPLQKNTSTPFQTYSEESDNLNHTNKHEEKSTYSKKDIHYSPATTPLNSSAINDEALREMMRQLSSMSNTIPNDFINNSAFNTTTQSSKPYLDSTPETPFMPDDPIVKVMQQLMGETLRTGEGADMPKITGLNDNQEKPMSDSPYAFFWRFMHAFWAISLGIYIAMITHYDGTEIERGRYSLGFDNVDNNLLLFASSPKNFFYLFMTVEAILLGTRYFLDKEDTKPAGILGMLIAVLQDPIRGYLLLGFRYINIWTIVSRDALICLFVLGVFAWWRK